MVGHELTHGFDATGRMYDEFGSLMGQTQTAPAQMGDTTTITPEAAGADARQGGHIARGWSNATTRAFAQRQACFIRQYSRFEVGGQHVSGSLTVNENMADNGGLDLAYRAYQRFERERERMHMHERRSDTGSASDGLHGGSDGVRPNVESSVVPGLTRDQLFFVAFAQNWCSKQTLQAAEVQLKVDVHSPAQWRVKGAAMNSRGFAAAFHCRPGSAMNPVDKCLLW